MKKTAHFYRIHPRAISDSSAPRSIIREVCFTALMVLINLLDSKSEQLWHEKKR